MNTKRDLRIWTNVWAFGWMGFLMSPALASDKVIPECELLITDLNVVDSKMAEFPGPWSFGHLVTELAGDEDVGEFVKNWLGLWEEDQVVNTFNVSARPAIREKIIEGWQRNDGYHPENGETWKPNLKNAPFRLLAIVNRLDLASQFHFRKSMGESEPELVAVRSRGGAYASGPTRR